MRSGPTENKDFTLDYKDINNITQKELKKLLEQKNNLNSQKFIKNTPVAFYKYDNLPDEIKNKIGGVDNTSYESYENKLIAVQYKENGTLDAYAIDEKTIEKTYVKKENLKVKGIEGIEPEFIGVKNTPVEMVQIKNLGIEENGKIESPWGDTQDFNPKDYFVLNGEEVYVCQLDEKTGLPIGYIKYENEAENTVDSTKESFDKIVGN